MPVAVKRTPWARSDGHFEICESQVIKDIVVVDLLGKCQKFIQINFVLYILI